MVMAWWDLRSFLCFNDVRAAFYPQGFLNWGQGASVLRNCCFLHQYEPLIEDLNQQSTMREGLPVTRTVRTHGVTLARTHMHDWLILILLFATLVILNVKSPFYRFVGKDLMEDLRYPLKQNTVPAWSVPVSSIQVYSAVLPIFIFLFFYLRRRDVYDLHHAILGVLFSVLISAVITDAIKDSVGRPRPDFFWRCFPDGKDVYDPLGNVVCHGQKHLIDDGHKSFPSGHTSWSFAGLGFLSLYLSGKIKAFDSRGHVAKLCLVFLPLLVASLVGISRVDDYRHHWEDVFAGGLLGLVVATFCYLQFFPPPYHVQGWATYAYFRVLEELQATELPIINPVNANNVSTSNALVEDHQNERTNHTVYRSSLSIDSNTVVENVETGRR